MDLDSLRLLLFKSEATDGCSIRSVLCRSSTLQKQSRVFYEKLRVLVVRAVIGVGIDDQLRVRDVLLHDERVHRGYVHVVTAVHDECWLLDRLQIVDGPLSLDAPLANSFDLGGRHLVVHFGIAALLPKVRALQEPRPAAWPAADGLNLTASQTFAGGSWEWAPKNRPVASAINSVPRPPSY